MTSKVEIARHGGAWPEDIDGRLEPAVFAALRAAEYPGGGAVSLVLADDAFVRGLNHTYRGKDKPTNVLSFPQETPDMLGDIILAYETIAREAQEQEKGFTEHCQHLTVHGTLHLLGYDHDTDPEAEAMESLEIKILQDLGVKNPYEMSYFVR